MFLGETGSADFPVIWKMSNNTELFSVLCVHACALTQGICIFVKITQFKLLSATVLDDVTMSVTAIDQSTLEGHTHSSPNTHSLFSHAHFPFLNSFLFLSNVLPSFIFLSVIMMYILVLFY